MTQPAGLLKDEMLEQYEVMGFALGLVVVRRKSDNVVGSMRFGGTPRRYYEFVAD